MEKTLADCGKIRDDCEIGWFDQEQPQRLHTLDSYEIAVYEVSNSQYELCVDVGICEPRVRNLQNEEVPYDPKYFSPEYPAVAVAFSQARAFCAWVEGRLPSEHEWEKAARGKEDNRLYPWGNDFEIERANLAVTVPPDLSEVFPEPIKSHVGDASPYGVVNMSGNVREWTTSLRNGKHIVRGGSWLSPYIEGRVTDRGTNLVPEHMDYDIGFRCVR
jgi:formylglycine-generating enzyme required for sulfatase activity